VPPLPAAAGRKGFRQDDESPMNDNKSPPRGQTSVLPELSEPDGSRPQLKIIIEPRPPVVRMPWWFTAIKVSIAGALLIWALLG
jgi:hypothetical protein